MREALADSPEVEMIDHHHHHSTAFIPFPQPPLSIRVTLRQQQCLPLALRNEFSNSDDFTTTASTTALFHVHIQ